MSAQQDAAIQFAIEQAITARQESRANFQAVGEPALLRMGVVASVAGDAYAVALLGADGETSATLQGVRAWGEVSFDPGDRVVVAWIGGRPLPVLLGGGSGGGSSFAFVGELGAAS
jgi:hypothetical protein